MEEHIKLITIVMALIIAEPFLQLIMPAAYTPIWHLILFLRIGMWASVACLLAKELIEQ